MNNEMNQYQLTWPQKTGEEQRQELLYKIMEWGQYFYTDDLVKQSCCKTILRKIDGGVSVNEYKTFCDKVLEDWEKENDR